MKKVVLAALAVLMFTTPVASAERLEGFPRKHKEVYLDPGQRVEVAKECNGIFDSAFTRPGDAAKLPQVHYEGPSEDNPWRFWIYSKITNAGVYLEGVEIDKTLHGRLFARNGGERPLVYHYFC